MSTRVGAKSWNKTWIVVAAVLTSLVFPGSCHEAFAEPAFVSMGTGPVSGLYYPTGRAICEAVNAAVGKSVLRCSVEATPGSVYNVEALASGEVEFALVQSDVQFFAVNGEIRWQGRPVDKLRSVMSLYPELLTIVARPDAGISGIEGLKGKRVNIGAPGSGTRATWDQLEVSLGMTRKDLAEATELKPEAAAERLCANKLDASLLIVGHPSKMVESELAACGLTLVAVSGPKIDKLVATRPYYVGASIPAAMYGLPGDISTFGGKTTLLTSADVPDDIVYELTKSVMDSLEKLKIQQPSLAGLKPSDMVQQSLIAPLHPGAARAYRELGLLK